MPKSSKMVTRKTDDKLSETRFFLQRLREENEKSFPPEPEAFRHYLSAFLSAARSVTWVLQKEAKEAYDAFFDGWKQTLSNEERELLDFMRDQRNLEVKEAGSKTTVLAEEMSLESTDGIHIFGAPYGKGKYYVLKWHFENKGRALTVCEHYLSLLERLLQEFRKSSMA